MKQTKWNPTAQPVPAVDVAEALGDPWQAGANTPDLLVRIEGLRAEPMAGEFMFSLEGVKAREVDWQAVAQAIGRTHLPDQLADEISAAVWKADMLDILCERIKPS